MIPAGAETQVLRALEAPGGPLALISRELVDRAVAYSRHSPRRRVIQPLHRSADEPVHRMLNAVQPDSYVRPHRHLDPPKTEAWIVLRGAVVFFAFDDDGHVRECLRLEAAGDPVGVDLAPGIYHTFAALEPDTVIYEVKTGPYSEATDKTFAPWAPEEGMPAAATYLEGLLSEYRRAEPSGDPLSAIAWRPPVLRSDRLILRGYESSDAPAIYAYASDEETTRYMAWDRHRSIEDAHGFLHGMVAKHYRRHRLDYAICLADDHARVIGGLGVYPHPGPHQVMELGYILGRPHWSRGLALEAVRRLLDHAFHTTDVERIFAPIFAENSRSRRLAEKAGLRLDGVLRSALAFRGRRWDEAVYAILRGDWVATRPPG
jgi:cupin fold WbuC family metalloprotein